MLVRPRVHLEVLDMDHSALIQVANFLVSDAPGKLLTNLRSHECKDETSYRFETSGCDVGAGLAGPAQASAASRAPELPNPGNAGISRHDQIELGFQAAARYAFHRNHISGKSASRPSGRDLAEFFTSAARA